MTPRDRRSTESWLRLAALLIGAIVLVTAQLPHVWAVRADRLGHFPDRVYTGITPTSNEDVISYFGWMKVSSEGRFLLEDRFTLEPHDHNYVNIFFTPLGWLVRATGASIPAVYHGARFVLGLALLVVLWLLAREAFARPWERLACFGLVLSCGGWEGPHNVFVRNLGWKRVSSPGWWAPEISTFFSMMTLPHLVASFIAMVAVTLFMVRAWGQPAEARGRRAAWASAAGLGLLVITFFHPYDTVTLVGMIGTAPLLVGCVERRWPLREAAASAIACGIVAPAILWNYAIFSDNPALRAMDVQAVMTTPEWGQMALALGAAGVLAVVALAGFRRMTLLQLTMAAWLVSAIALAQLPLRFQRRMLGGIQIPLAILATFAIAWLIAPPLEALFRRLARRDPGEPGASRSGWGVALTVAILMPLVAATPWYVRDIEWRELRRHRFPSWIARTEHDALAALERLRPEGATVLASNAMGGFVPASTASRTFVGHYSLTIDWEEKKAQALRFFDAATDDAWRIAFLRRWGIDHVLHTVHERELGSFDPAAAPYLERLFVAGEGTSDAAAIYVVRLDSAPGQPAAASPAP